MRKKLLSVLTALALCLSLLPTAVFADSGADCLHANVNEETGKCECGTQFVAKRVNDGTTEWLTAFPGTLNGGDEITLYQDVSTGDLTINNWITLDLNGKKLTANVTVTSSEVKIKNGTINGALTISELNFSEFTNLTVTGLTTLAAAYYKENGKTFELSGLVFQGGVTTDDGYTLAERYDFHENSWAFAKASDESVLVDGYVQTISEAVQLVYHPTHYYKNADYKCACGEPCGHAMLLSDGKCAYCDKLVTYFSYAVGGQTHTFVTFQEAYESEYVPDGATIKLLEDYTLKPADISAVNTGTKTVKLDKDGHMLSGSVDSNKVTIIDGQCPHTNVNDTGYCSACKTQLVAKRTDTSWNVTWHDDFDSAANNADGCTITLMDDVPGSNAWKIENGQAVTLDLNGHRFERAIKIGEYVGENVAEGYLTIQDSGTNGTVTEELTATCRSLTITGGTFASLRWNYPCKVHVSGGTFQQITVSDGESMKDMLAAGYAFRYTDDAESSVGQMVKLSSLGRSLNHVEVVQCVDHSADANGKCEYCKSDAAASVTRGTGDGATTTYYASFGEAYKNATDGDTITLLTDAQHAEFDKNITLTIDLNEKKLTSSAISSQNITISKGTYLFKNGTVNNGVNVLSGTTLELGDDFKLEGTGYKVYLNSKAKLNVTGDNVAVAGLHVSGCQNVVDCKLTKGTFGTIKADAKNPIESLLESGYAFKTTSGETKWYDAYNNSNEMVINNVTVTAVPITSVAVDEEKLEDLDKQTDGSYKTTYGLTRWMKFKFTKAETGACSYQFFVDGEAYGNSIEASNPDMTEHRISFNLNSLSAGKHTVCIKVTKDGYTKSAEATVNVTKATPTYTAPTANTLTYDGGEQELVKAGTTSGGTMQYKVGVNGTWSNTVPEAKNAGNYTVYWKIDGGTNYEDVAEAAVPVTINHVEISANITVAEKEYDGTTDATVMATVNANDLIAGDEITISGLTGTFDNKNVGTGKTVTIGSSKAVITGTNSENYHVTFPTSDNTGVITAKPVTATVTVADKEYDGTTNATVTATVDKADLCGDDSITISGLTGTFEDANAGTNKTVTINATDKNIGGSGSENYDVTIPTTAKGEIKAASLTGVSVRQTGTLTYSGQPQTAAVETAATAVNGQPVSFTYSTTENGTYSSVIPSFNNADTYTVYYKASADNHNETTGSFSVTIGKAALTVTAKPHSITYGDAPANDGVEYSGFVGGETASVLTGTLVYDYSYVQYGNVGNNYTITPKGLTSTNYAITFVPGTLTVMQKEIGIDWSNTDLVYNGSAQKPTATATATDLVNGDTCTITVTGEQTNAGENYTATATGLSNSNYKLPANVTTTFTIARASQTVTATAASVSGTYGDTDKAVSASGIGTVSYAVTSGSDVVSVDAQTGALTFLKAGKATVTATAAGDLNHLPNHVDISVTVAKASVTIKAEDQWCFVCTRVPDLSAPVLDEDYTVTGLIGEDVLEDTVTVVLSYGSDLNVNRCGRYEIIPSVIGEDSRYAFVFENGTLKVYPWPTDGNGSSPLDDFTDLDKDAWYAEAVEYCLDEGLMSGTGNGKFSPNGGMTRAMVWTVLGRLSGETFKGTGANWYADAQKWAIRAGISDGTNPNGQITREELVTMLWRFVGSPKADTAVLKWYGDSATISDWAQEAMAWAVSCSLVEGSNWNLTPNAVATRCQVAAIFMRYHKN